MRKPIIGSMRLGAWGAAMQPQAVADFLAACADLGADEVDLADIYGDYGTNRLVGAALAARPELRQRLRLIAKVGIIKPTAGSQDAVYRYDSSAAGLRRAIDTTFADLGVDRVDLLMLHRYDFLTEPDAVASIVQPLIDAGRVGAFGVSNFSNAALDLLAARIPVTAHQIELSALRSSSLDDGTHAHSRLRGCDVMAWSPLGGGKALQEGVSATAAATLDRLCEVHGLNRAQLLLRWVHTLPSTRAVLGTRQIERVAQAIDAARHPLPQADWYAVLQAMRGARLP